MTAPLDLLTGAQDATVKLLRDQLPAAQREMVRHSLKQGTTPPFHLVGDMDSDNIGGKDEQFEQINVDVHTVYKGADRRELLGLMHTVRIAIDGKSLTIGDMLFRFQFAGAAASTAAADGVTYAGITTIEVYAEPADPAE